MEAEVEVEAEVERCGRAGLSQPPALVSRASALGFSGSCAQVALPCQRVPKVLGRGVEAWGWKAACMLLPSLWVALYLLESKEGA